MVGTMVMNRPAAARREREKQSVTFPLCKRKKTTFGRPSVGGWLPTVQQHIQMHLAMSRVFHTRYIPPAILPLEWPHSRGTISPPPLRGTTISRRVRLPAGRIPEKYCAMIAAGSWREGFCFVYTNTMVKKKPHRFFCFSPINNNSFVHPSHARAFVQCWHRTNKKISFFPFEYIHGRARGTRHLIL